VKDHVLRMLGIDVHPGLRLYLINESLQDLDCDGGLAAVDGGLGCPDLGEEAGGHARVGDQTHVSRVLHAHGKGLHGGHSSSGALHLVGGSGRGSEGYYANYKQSCQYKYPYHLLFLLYMDVY
jgi:hypothetical protein